MYTSEKLKRGVGAFVRCCREERFCSGPTQKNTGRQGNCPASQCHFLLLTASSFASPDFGKMPRTRATQRVRKKSRINSDTHLPAVRTGNQARFVAWAAPRKGTAETPRWGGCPPIWVGQASRPAIRRPHSPGRCPGIPLPLKGCKSAIQRRAPHAEFAPLKQRKEPCQREVC